MLVTRIIGKCPECGTNDSFGNVNVTNNILVRGCLHCRYSERIPLPKISKEILYLDQFFLSHAFRSKLSKFVEAAKLIDELAHNQLLVCPYSSIHETETHQWRHSEQQMLWKFIKQTSRGHSFSSEFDIRRIQIMRGFKRFLNSVQTSFEILNRDALKKDINTWDDYFWIDLKEIPENVELTRSLKEQTIEGLVSLFPEWRKSTTSFEEEVLSEMVAEGKSYFDVFFKRINLVRRGDLMAIFNSPVDSMIVEHLINLDQHDTKYIEKLKRISSYFSSKYFGELPHVWISTRLYAALRDRVKKGQYQNTEKAKKQLGGFFYDVSFVSAYAPYCDAMFIDNAMYELVNDKRLKLSDRYRTKFFARTNWKDFIKYLISLREKTTQEIEWALNLIYT